MMTNYMNKKERKSFFRECGIDKSKALYTRPLRIKVYARVSTEHESQLNALENQLEWYKSRVSDNWHIDFDKDMYIDRGITGTSAKRREAFLQMIHDAKSDDCDFDVIITREVPRFARNVEETFQYTRELREYGVGVYFMAEDIWSFDDSSEGIMRLSIMSSIAQGESKKVSDRAKWGQEISRKHGQPYGNGNILGYDKVHHKKGKDINPETGMPYNTTFTYVKNEEQSRTVEKIFELCLQGLGTKRIKKYLMQEGYLTATGHTTWKESTINRILNNPTYMGYAAYGKSKVVDYLSHEKEYCTDLDKLQLVKGDWEPIVSEDIWYKALEERTKRKVSIIQEDGSASKYGQPSEMNMWIRKLQCSCGSGFRRNKWRMNSLSEEMVFGFECWNQINNSSKKSRERLGLPTEGACNVGQLQECKLDLMAKRIFEIVWKDRKEAMRRAIEMITECSKTTIVDNSDKIASYKKKIATEEASQLKTVELASKGLISESLLTNALSESRGKIKQYENAIEELSNTTENDFDKSKMLKDIEEAFNIMINFDVPVINYNVIDRFIRKIIVREDSELVWVLNFNTLMNMKPIERINHLSEEYKKTLVVDTNFNIFLEFEISVDECAEYMKTRGRRIRKGQWRPLKVKVALDLNN